MVRTSRVFSVPPGSTKANKKLSGAAGVDPPPQGPAGAPQEALTQVPSRNSVKGVFDSINFIPTTGKLLPDIHSVKNVFIVEIQSLPPLSQ
jgi:hypothetical protein